MRPWSFTASYFPMLLTALALTSVKVGAHPLVHTGRPARLQQGLARENDRTPPLAVTQVTTVALWDGQELSFLMRSD